MPGSSLCFLAAAGALAALLGSTAVGAAPVDRTAANPASVAAQEAPPVDVALVLAVDISLSMDQGEQQLQRTGYVEALRHPDLLRAIGNGLYQRIAITYVEWGSATDQQVILPWTLIEDAASATAAAAALEAEPISRSRSTAISTMLHLGRELHARQPSEAMRRVIDISGDGPNNDGGAVTAARDAVLADGITINGLPVMLRAMGFSPWTIPELDDYYADCVIGGPGSFILAVRDPADFKSAIRRKLLLEIAGQVAERVPANSAQAQAEPPSDCLIGEKLRRQLWQPD